MSDSCFHLLLRLSFSGTCGLPRFSLQRLKRCRRSPCFTSHSPKSCKHGCQWRYCAKSSETCVDKRMCPASLQSSTSCATLIRDLAKFVLSLASVILLTGPLLTPIRNRIGVYSLTPLVVLTAPSAGSSGRSINR